MVNAEPEGRIGLPEAPCKVVHGSGKLFPLRLGINDFYVVGKIIPKLEGVHVPPCLKMYSVRINVFQDVLVQMYIFQRFVICH